MLRIRRRVGERIVIGDGIIVEIIGVEPNAVRIGIDAPRDVPVYREELWKAVQAENLAAASPDVRLPAPDDPPAG
ncbi:MAG: carbon storage regulator [Solirubrobacteraceae bacterium]|nr:carbon storage regulator [Solirubrobacteraceae bacterium]